MAARTEHSVAAATHEAKQPDDISRPPAGILIVDNFLDEAEISDALTQLERLEQERGDQQTATCPAKRQFLINVPAVADRLRSEIDASLGLAPIEATEGGAPQQEWLPARVMHGPTAEHRDEPQSGRDATKLDKEAYRGGYIAIRKARFHRQVTFYLLVIHWVWIILGLVITVNINISGSHSSCPPGLYWFTVLSIAALYVNMSLMMVPVALEYTKWQALAIGGPCVGACAVVALALATEVPWFGVILVAASTFPTLVILNLVAIDVRKLVFYKAYLLEKIEKLEHKLAKAKQYGDEGDVDEYSRKLADRRAELASLGNSS